MMSQAPFSVPLVDRKQLDVERRVLQLIEFSSLAGSLRDDTELARKMVSPGLYLATSNPLQILPRGINNVIFVRSRAKLE